MARLSDEDETRLSMALASSGSRPERAGRALPAPARPRGRLPGLHRLRGRRRTTSRAGAARAAAVLRAARRRGARPAARRAWLRGRFAAPYLRDELLDRGVMVETLETATTWSNLHRLYAAVGRALRERSAARGTPPLVMCHISHLYPSGASLYFTFIARQEPGAELDQWRAAKTAACDAIVGQRRHDHPPPRRRPRSRAVDGGEVGALGLDVLRGGEGALDPAGIMNPGKLLPDSRWARRVPGARARAWPAGPCSGRPGARRCAAQDRVAGVAAVRSTFSREMSMNL